MRRLVVLWSSLAWADVSLPRDPLGVAGRHQVPGEMIEGSCADAFFDMCMDLTDLRITYDPVRGYRMVVGGGPSLALRREGARLVGESVRAHAGCEGAQIRERWSLARAPEGRVVGDFLISEPERCPFACNGRWRLGGESMRFRF